ncbi:MAG: hypothetical protein QW351_09785 [Candidatus Caldarchaeum sp.]
MQAVVEVSLTYGGFSRRNALRAIRDTEKMVEGTVNLRSSMLF